LDVKYEAAHSFIPSFPHYNNRAMFV